MKNFLKEMGITLGLALIIFLGFHAVIQTYVVREQCMEPDFYEGDRLLVNKLAYKFSGPQRGDVVILHPPFDIKLVFIKRVIGLPGDTVAVREGAVFINGTKLDEPYLKEPIAYTMPSQTIPENEYFVLGDNRNIANDSHSGWMVPQGELMGKALMLYWPIRDWGAVRHYSLADQLAGAAG
jgi:signal peptidase I